MIATGLVAVPAAAEPLDDDSEVPAGPAFRYRARTESYYVRAVLEELAILGLGELQYFSNTANAVDWDLAYDWESFRSKLTFRSYSFDTNLFATNWATHPAAGYLYYSAARSNRLSLTESFLFAAAASTTWEYLGEYREQVAINDLIATPVGGAVFAEATMQLGALFQRSRRTPTTTALAWLFAPAKMAHDAVDGASLARTDDLDAWGLPADEWHRIRVAASAGVTKQDAGLTQSDARLATSSRVVALTNYGRPGRGSVLFDSGEVSDIDLSATMSTGNLVDFRLAADVMPAGVYWKNLGGTKERPVGHGILGGMTVGIEYGNHVWYREGLRPTDQVGMVDTGATFEHTLYAGGLALRSSLSAHANFAGVSAFALTDYLRAHPIETLNTILREQGYYHAVGATVHPSIDLRYRKLELGAAARIDWFGAINALDRAEADEGELETPRDRRIELRASVGLLPVDYLRIGVSAERRHRKGRVGSATASRGETSLFGSFELFF